MRNANQLVLIGDQKQLGPIFKSEVNEDCDSTFSRLISGGHKYHMLSTQFRMHDYLLKVPNSLFYDGKITSGY